MIIRPGTFRSKGVSPFGKLLRAFSTGRNGAIYDPSDISTLYQDSGRTTPVTAVTDPVGSISDKSGNLNYAIQATAAARPTWTNRVNLLTYTEQFDNAYWIGSGISANAIAAPDGTVTAEKFTVAAPVDAFYRANFPFIAGTYTISVYYKAGTNAYPAICIGSSLNPSVAAIFNLTDGTMSQSNAVGTGTILSTSIVSVGAGWYRCSMTFSGISTAHHIKFEQAPAPTGNTFDVNGDITNNIVGQYYYVWGAQLQHGTTATRYQRVTTATDFDTVGFPYYLSFLGVDDSLTSATGGGGSAGFFWCGVVQPTGGAGTLQTLFADNGTNTGYKVQKDVNNKLSFSAGDNAAFTTKVSTAALSVGTKYLLTVLDDGVNLSVQIDAVAAETVARPVVVAGTAGFTLCKDNGAASSFLIGNLYPSVYFRDTAGTAAERAAAQAWANSMGGM